MSQPTDEQLRNWLIDTLSSGESGSHFLFQPCHARTNWFAWACRADGIFDITHNITNAKKLWFFAFAINAYEDGPITINTTVSSNRPYMLAEPGRPPGYSVSFVLTIFAFQIYSNRKNLDVVHGGGGIPTMAGFKVKGVQRIPKKPDYHFTQELRLT